MVAKCWDPNPQGYFTVSKQEPVRPIDPSAWVAHTQAHTGVYPIGSNVNNYAKQQIINSNDVPKILIEIEQHIDKIYETIVKLNSE